MLLNSETQKPIDFGANPLHGFVQKLDFDAPPMNVEGAYSVTLVSPSIGPYVRLVKICV